MAKKSSQKTIKITTDMKYKLYETSVQNHLGDIEFINEEYKRIRGRLPLSLREDFCGTGALACDWVRQSRDHWARGVDLDPEPISYGKKNHYQRLNSKERERMTYVEGNVLDPYDFKTDVVVAFNFSYFIFKKRLQLLNYFKQVREGLGSEGIFFVDIFGGTECFQELEEETEFGEHSYYWDCDRYNPLTNEALYFIHFKLGKKGKKYREVFTYDWRHWTVAEIVELMEEAGFSNVQTYWEEDDDEDEGEGSGEFYPSECEENCESWVTYVVGSV